MNMPSDPSHFGRSHFGVLVALLSLGLGACSDSSAANQANHDAAQVDPVGDAPLADWRRDLLDLAFDAGSAFPLEVHLKNRSRAQEAVVTAALELDQPRWALAHVDQISNWRRASCRADIAFHLAEKGGDEAEIQALLDAAGDAADRALAEGEQEWRIGRMRAGIARTLLALGRPDEALALAAHIDESELARVGAVHAGAIRDEEVARVVDSLQKVAGGGTFDQRRNAAVAGVELYGRCYDDPELRGRLQDLVEVALAQLPVSLRLESALRQAELALEHEDADGARKLIAGAEGLFEESAWTPVDRVPLTARLAEMRYRAGDAGRAREQLVAALALYEAEREAITDIDRADALRPVAEALVTMGDERTARTIYARLLEDGAENPNARPRADDLVATCCSMAVRELEPDAELWKRLREVRAGLADPW